MESLRPGTLRLSAEEAIGQPLTMLTLPADLAQLLYRTNEIKNSRRVETFDTVRVQKGGQHIDLEVVMSPVKDAAGEVIGASTIARDITQRKKVETALQASEAHLTAIFAQAKVGLSEIALDGRFLRVNHELCRILGRSEEELVGLNVADVTYPGDVPANVGALRRDLVLNMILLANGCQVAFVCKWSRTKADCRV